MQNQVDENKPKPFTKAVSVIVVLNILVTIFVGFIVFYFIGVGDPATNVIDIAAFLMQKHFETAVVNVLTMFFTIGFIISLVLWLKEKHYSSFILSGLALLHFLAFIYCIIVIQLPMFSYLFSALDLVLIVIIFRNESSHYSAIKV